MRRFSAHVFTSAGLALALLGLLLSAPAPAGARVLRHAPVRLRRVVVTIAQVPWSRPVHVVTHHASQVYWVRGGDTLTAIAKRVYGHGGLWPKIWWANRHAVHNPNMVRKGQKLILPYVAKGDPPSRSLVTRAYHAIPRPPVIHSVVVHYTSPVWSDPVGTYTQNTAQAVQQASPQPAPAPVSYGGGYPGGAFGACVVARESGGNSQVMNASAHWGLYQFSASTWAAYGGNPADFGSGSVAEQNQVFANALAQGGQSNWSQYDGCTP